MKIDGWQVCAITQLTSGREAIWDARGGRIQRHEQRAGLHLRDKVARESADGDIGHGVDDHLVAGNALMRSSGATPRA